MVFIYVDTVLHKTVKKVQVYLLIQAVVSLVTFMMVLK